MDNPEKLTTQGTQDEEEQNKNTTQYVLDTTMHKQTNKNTVSKTRASHKQPGAKTNRISCLCGNRNGHHNTELGT